jgi:Phorbol esters/diacylglycerol binding domain (C1 domain)
MAIRRSGLLKIKLVGASNLTDRKSLRDEIVAVISVDGIQKYTTRGTKTKWDEVFDIPLEKALEVEIAIFEKGGQLLGMVWFKVKDLEDDLNTKYPTRLRTLDVTETWLELEPSGQLLTKLNFVAIQRSTTHKDKIFRRDNVQKVYPRNGHLFTTKEFYQVLKCAVCNEFLGRQGYQCDSCQYTIHPRCYNRVITKCIPPAQIASVFQFNL